ncbi:c-type cytochrome [Sphingomonas immobilis]|uniref:Cytochrome c n=1 Tax=Sphingomonas immobilis TaxID=3063997 RepID=A0ABT9A0H7_9SPHN|nr:cytochrome c [Sphingomonas sp. CA1-15]MDO7842496.1 cytochrome c [Sphingomonas sp. CA1-15]
MSWLRRYRIAIGAVLIVCAGVLVVLLMRNGDTSADMVADDTAKAADKAQLDPKAIERGRAVAVAADCAACHTRPGGGRAYAGGYTLQTPFGDILSSNITPDRATGIGDWTERDFFRAVRHGRSPRHMLYPAMPYPSYVRISDADMHDMWSYFRSLPAASGDTGGTRLGFPFNVRELMLGWNLLFFRNDAPARAGEVNRGQYLVDVLGHCGACHTAKNALGGDSGYLGGGTLQDWHAPALHNGMQHGLGSWSDADIVAYLKTGSNAHSIAAGPMAEAVEHSTQYMPDADLRAMAAYLKKLPGPAETKPQPVAANDPAMVRGARVYVTACSGCHAPGGTGIAGMATRLADNPAIRAPDTASLTHVLMTGSRAAATDANPTAAGMPGFAWKLSDADAAAVLTYVRNTWGNAAPAVSAGDVAKARRALKARKPM